MSPQWCTSCRPGADPLTAALINIDSLKYWVRWAVLDVTVNCYYYKIQMKSVSFKLLVEQSDTCETSARTQRDSAGTLSTVSCPSDQLNNLILYLIYIFFNINWSWEWLGAALWSVSCGPPGVSVVWCSYRWLFLWFVSCFCLWRFLLSNHFHTEDFLFVGPSPPPQQLHSVSHLY